MRAIRTVAVAFTLSLQIAGCNTTKPLIPDKVLNISPSLQVPYEVVAATIIAGVVVWKVMDPLAPTWDIRHIRHSHDRFEITLRQKRFAVGGDGEAQYLFRRHAQALAARHGYPVYDVLSYEESVESGPVIGQRVSRGMIVLGHSTRVQAHFAAPSNQ